MASSIASSERPLFESPFIGALTGTVSSQPFPLNAPPSNVSRQTPRPSGLVAVHAA